VLVEHRDPLYQSFVCSKQQLAWVKHAPGSDGLATWFAVIQATGWYVCRRA
jgi:hypothetical protein